MGRLWRAGGITPNQFLEKVQKITLHQNFVNETSIIVK